MNASTPIPTAERIPLMGATLSATTRARELGDAFHSVDRVFDDDHEISATALRSIARAALAVIHELATAVVEFDEAHSSPAPANDERVNWNLRPGDRTVFARGPLDHGFVLIDRRGDDPRSTRSGGHGMIVYSPHRRQWEHWTGGRCSGSDLDVEALSRRYPAASIHAPADDL